MRDFWFILSLVISSTALAVWCFWWPWAGTNNFGWGLLGIMAAGIAMGVLGLHMDRSTYGDRP